MKIINLNSKNELTPAQISFAESVIIYGEDEPIKTEDSISSLINNIPIFLVNTRTQEEYSNGDLLGFYQHSGSILNTRIPVIGLCIDRIIEVVNSEEELIILIAKVIVHEFAHAKMGRHPGAGYYLSDEFYKWMEEPMANLITLEYFENFNKLKSKNLAHVKTQLNPFDFVKDFVSKQPDNYKLGLDLFKHRIRYWWIWRSYKNKIKENTEEKNAWLNYVKNNVGDTDKEKLNDLFEALYKNKNE